MKKNYLIFTLLGALVLGGCKNDNNTSSSSSNSTSENTPTVAAAVSYISNNYTINYSLTDSNGSVWNYANKLEKVKNLDGAEGNLAYYSEYSELGYYIMAEDDAYVDGYQFYLNGYGKPVYNTNGRLGAEDIANFEILVDLNGNFSKAEWELDSTKDGVNEFFTNDTLVIATASFLTDYLSEENPVAFVKAIVKEDKLSGFTTFDADGNTITEASIKRVGGSMAIDYVPYLDDELDECLVTKWMIASEYGNHLGGYLSSFEINSKGELVVYSLDQETGAYVKSTETYTYSQPSGSGYYIFEKTGSSDYVMLRITGGDVLFYTYDYETDTMGVDFAVEYYTGWFMLAINYLNSVSTTHTYYMEEIPSGDVNYDIVTSLNAKKGYYLYANTIDSTTGEEITEYMVLLVQYLNKEVAIQEYFGGDTATYNGFAMSGYAFGNLALAAYYSAESMRIIFDIASVIPTEYCDYDMSKYPAVTEGQTALDYVIGYFESEGYSYVNKETADPEFVVNEKVDSTTGEVLEEGTNFYNEINEIVEAYASVKDSNENELFGAVDYYIFYKEMVDETTGETFVVYAGVMVCNTNMEGYSGGYDNLFVFGYGYFNVTGAIYEALNTWYITK